MLRRSFNVRNDLEALAEQLACCVKSLSVIWEKERITLAGMSFHLWDAA